MSVPPLKEGRSEWNEPFADADGSKDVFLLAAGTQDPGLFDHSRQVAVAWVNGALPLQPTTSPTLVYQLVQLEKDLHTGYHFTDPYIKPCDPEMMANSLTIPLGNFTLVERDRIIELATEIPYVRSSRVNGCRVWTRDVLLRMVGDGMISWEIYHDACARVPLQRREPELAHGRGPNEGVDEGGESVKG